MQFIEFEEILTTSQMTMSAPHSHEFYELYFLLDGKRNFFTKNKMFVVEENTLIVVPPYSFHKTEAESMFLRFRNTPFLHAAQVLSRKRIG